VCVGNGTVGVCVGRFFLQWNCLCMCVGLFYNGTNGNLTCFNITSEFLECADVTGCGTGPAAVSWDYQVGTYTRNIVAGITRLVCILGILYLYLF